MTHLEELQQEFESIARNNIKRDGLENLLNYLNETDFYRSPASTRYHGSYAGGLVEHSINVYYSLWDELQFIYGPNWEKKYTKESVTIVSLFHDLCKIGKYKPGTRNVKDPVTGQWHEERVYQYDNEYVPLGHGSKSLYIVQNHLHLTEEEAGAIYWHMGAYDLGNYNTIGDLSNSWNKNILGFELHRADMMSTYVVENEYFEPVGIEETTEENKN